MSAMITNQTFAVVQAGNGFKVSTYDTRLDLALAQLAAVMREADTLQGAKEIAHKTKLHIQDTIADIAEWFS